MSLFLPEKDLLRRFFITEDQIKDLEFLSDKLKFHSQHFHVFLLGGTGSGKSTLLNCLAGQNLATTGMQRPTTTELTVYGHINDLEMAEGTIKKFAPKPEDPTIFQSLVLWDFPDLDSHQITNHQWSYLFKHYADCILLVVHPEKTKQASLIKLVEEYPGIPNVLVLTHKDQYSPCELEIVVNDLELIYKNVLSVDSVSDFQDSKTKMTMYFESIKKAGFQKFKNRNISNLIQHCEPALKSLQLSLSNQVSGTESAMKEVTKLLKNSSKILSPVVFQVFQEKIFAEVQNELFQRLYKTTPGWSVLILESLSNLRTKKLPLSKKAIAYQALPFYSLQNKCSVLSFSESLLNSFRRDHMSMILDNQQRLRSRAQSYSVLQWIMAFLLEVMFPGWLVFQVVNNLSVGSFSVGMSLLAIILGLLASFISGFLRLRQRLKNCYGEVWRLYQSELFRWFTKIFEQELERLNIDSEEQRRSLESVNELLQLPHTSS